MGVVASLTWKKELGLNLMSLSHKRACIDPLLDPFHLCRDCKL